VKWEFRDRGHINVQRLWNAIDLHVAFMSALLAPFAYLGWWWLAVPLFAPQGRIYVRAFWDYPAFGKPARVYVVANELLVLSIVGILAAIRFAAQATTAIS
jgi:hypothetical protein